MCIVVVMADGGELNAEHLELRVIQSKQDIENPPTLQSVGITAINLRPYLMYFNIFYLFH